MDISAEVARLVGQEKWEEALTLLNHSLEEALTPQERSAAAAELALLYLKINAALAGDYLERTEEIDKLIQEIDAKEREIDDEVAIAKIKEHISSVAP